MSGFMVDCNDFLKNASHRFLRPIKNVYKKLSFEGFLQSKIVTMTRPNSLNNIDSIFINNLHKFNMV